MPDFYTDKAARLGLPREKMYGHDWVSTGSETVLYLEEHRKIIPIERAMDSIRGLNYCQIKAAMLGLPREKMHEHNWTGARGIQTVTQLKTRPKGMSIEKAMDAIRGLDYYQADAALLGLPQKKMQGHNWTDRAGVETITYLRNRPKTISIEQAMDNIRGLGSSQILDIKRYQKRGIEELNLTPEQVYIRKFGEREFNAISAGQSYEQVMPKAFNALLNLSQHQGYTPSPQRAASLIGSCTSQVTLASTSKLSSQTTIQTMADSVRTNQTGRL